MGRLLCGDKTGQKISAEVQVKLNVDNTIKEIPSSRGR
jgi:hypothetical protein